jgi:hypothetical protein
MVIMLLNPLTLEVIELIGKRWMGGVEWFNSHVSPINIRYSTTSQQRLWPTNGKVLSYLPLVAHN